MTTAEKILQMRDHLAQVDPEELSGPARDFAQNLQIVKGLFNWDPFDLVLPDDPTEIEEMIDGAIGLLLNLRGDELPPFEFTRYLDEPLDDGDRAELEGHA